jgi:hypothetical protein
MTFAEGPMEFLIWPDDLNFLVGRDEYIYGSGEDGLKHLSSLTTYLGDLQRAILLRPAQSLLESCTASGFLILVSALVVLLLLRVIAFVVLLSISAPVIPSAPLKVVLVLIAIVPRDIPIFTVAAPVGQVSLLFLPPLPRLSSLLPHDLSEIFELLLQLLVLYRLGCGLSSHRGPIREDHKLLADCVFAAKENWLIYVAEPLRGAGIQDLLSLLRF